MSKHGNINYTCIHLVAMGLPLALKQNNSTFGLGASCDGNFLFPHLITNILLKCDKNFKFSCCWCVLTTSNLSPNKPSNFFCKLKQRKIHTYVHKGEQISLLFNQKIKPYASTVTTLTLKYFRMQPFLAYNVSIYFRDFLFC